MMCWTTVSAFLLWNLMFYRVVSKCPWNDKNHFLEFKVGVLLWKKDVSFSKDFQAFLNKDKTMKECVRIYFMSYDVWNDFRMPVDGWTRIQDVMVGQGIPRQVDIDLVIGPYYMNVAMILEQLGIPYLVTDNKGYGEWMDMNRVDDPVHWGNMVELIPQIQEQNQAVVQLFATENWDSAVMIMPENEMGNRAVKKKCSASGRKKGHDIMQKWIKSITNHLWYCCSACNGDAEELKRLWHSILHHVVGVHQWEDEDGTKRSCNHPPLSPEEQEIKIWFDPTSTVYRDLTSIVMDRRLSNDLEQLALFKHTSGLEVYHSLMLKFAPKRTHFHYPAMKGRMQLAVLDHNHNTGRQVATTHTECQDLATQMSDSGVSLIPFSITTNHEDTKYSLQRVLRLAELQGKTRIIICSPRDKHDKLIKDVLQQAKRFDLIRSDESIFLVTEPTSTLQALAGNSFFKLGLHNARCMILAFRYVRPKQDGRGKSDIHQAAANDSGRVVQEALRMFFVDNAGEDKLEMTSKKMIQYMKEVEVQGDTGWIQFNSTTGQRVNYTLELYKHGGNNGYSKLAQWKPNQTEGSSGQLELNADSDISREDTKIGIFPDIVKVVTVLEKPFVIQRSENDFVGFTMDILDRLSEMLHFEYKIYISPGNRYGVKDNEQQVWDGMIGEILNGNATLAMGAISITSQREQVVDFSLGVINTGIDILIPKPKETFTIFQFIKPFSPNLWLAIVGSFLLVSLIYFALDYAYDVRQFTLKETFWFSVGTLMRRDTDFSPRHSSQRILSAGFTFFVLITVSTYTANMAAFLTTTNIEDAIDSLEALSEANGVKVYTVADSATMNFLKKGTKGVYNRLWQKIKSNSGLVANAGDAIKLVNENQGVFVFDYLINQYAEMQFCKTRSVGSPIMLQEHGIGMPAGAAFKSKIDIALLKLIEDGVIRNLRKRWWYDKSQCDPMGKEEKSSTKIQFDLQHMAGVFIVGLFGLACSAAFFLFKKFYLLAKPIEVPKE